MVLGAYGIPREDWPAATRLGFWYTINGHEMWDMLVDTKVGEYLDDVEPGRNNQADFEAWAQGVVDRDLLPVCSMVPSFLGSIGSATRGWGSAQHALKGYQVYWYSPFGWSTVDAWIQRLLLGVRLRRTMWFGVAQTVWNVYDSSDRWRPLGPSAIRTQMRQFERAGAAMCFFFPWHKEALTRALQG